MKTRYERELNAMKVQIEARDVEKRELWKQIHEYQNKYPSRFAS
jgi:hypothetical protein